MKKSRFWGLGVAVFALFLVVYSPAKAEAQSVKGTYWMCDLADPQAEPMGMRLYILLQFTDTKVNIGSVGCAISDHNIELTNQLIQAASGGKTSGEANIVKTIDFTQSGNTITLVNDGTATLSNNGLNVTVNSKFLGAAEYVFSKVNLVAGKWPNIVDQPELMVTK